MKSFFDQSSLSLKRYSMAFSRRSTSERRRLMRAMASAAASRSPGVVAPAWRRSILRSLSMRSCSCMGCHCGVFEA